MNMRTKIAKILGSIIVVGVLALGSISIITARGQQSGGSSAASNVTTNWLGYLVAGQADTADRISSNPSPTVVRQVEIGLRSDGVVVWREAGRGK
jgi:hypothetical protein